MQVDLLQVITCLQARHRVQDLESHVLILEDSMEAVWQTEEVGDAALCLLAVLQDVKASLGFVQVRQRFNAGKISICLLEIFKSLSV